MIIDHAPIRLCGRCELGWAACCPCCSPLPGAVTCLADLLPPPASVMPEGAWAPPLHINVMHPMLDVRCSEGAVAPMYAVATLASRSGDVWRRCVERWLPGSFRPLHSAALA